MKCKMMMICLMGLMATIGAHAADDTGGSSTNPPSSGHHGARPAIDNLLPPRLLEKLELTTEQKTKYDSLNASFKKDLAKAESSSTSTNSPSTGHRGMREMHELRKKYVDQLRPSLTTEQTATLDKAAENMRNRREGQSAGSASTPKPSSPPADN